ncbi:MAG: hypothetical protein VX679_06470 [Pseudomonadota bacterium]|nr:hypothetical protein [Pseudomonadota bacterium]
MLTLLRIPLTLVLENGGGTEMLKEDGILEIRTLHCQGLRIRAMACEMGISSNTTREYLGTQKQVVFANALTEGKARSLQVRSMETTTF